MLVGFAYHLIFMRMIHNEPRLRAPTYSLHLSCGGTLPGDAPRRAISSHNKPRKQYIPFEPYEEAVKKKDGGIEIAGRDAGVPRDAVAICGCGHDALPGYRAGAGAWEREGDRVGENADKTVMVL